MAIVTKTSLVPSGRGKESFAAKGQPPPEAASLGQAWQSSKEFEFVHEDNEHYSSI